MSDLQNKVPEMNWKERASQIKNGALTLAEWLGEGGIPVDKELAQKRADICLRCPKHIKDWPVMEAVAWAVKKQIEVKNHLNMKVRGEKSLHTCSACGCVLKLKVHCPLRIVAPEPDEHDKYWEECWLLTEQ